MTRLILSLTMGLAAASLSHIAAAQSLTQTVTLDPGLYDVSHVMTMAGRTMPADISQTCIREGENSKTLEDMLSGLSEDGQCTFSNAAMTASTGRVDYVCSSDEMPFDVTGTMEAEYGSDFYTVVANGTFGPMGAVTTKVSLRRSGACPADWVEPEEEWDDE